LTIVPSGPRLRRQRRMRRRPPPIFKLKSQRGAEKLEKESDVKDNGIALTRDIRSAYEKIHAMINANKDESADDVLIRVGNAGIKLHHDIFEEIQLSDTEEADDDDEKRVARRRKAWKKSEVEEWKEGKDFDWKFNPFWRTEDTERFRDLLLKKEFALDKTVDHFMELKALINKEWIYFVFRWQPKETTGTTSTSAKSKKINNIIKMKMKKMKKKMKRRIKMRLLVNG